MALLCCLDKTANNCLTITAFIRSVVTYLLSLFEKISENTWFRLKSVFFITFILSYFLCTSTWILIMHRFHTISSKCGHNHRKLKCSWEILNLKWGREHLWIGIIWCVVLGVWGCLRAGGQIFGNEKCFSRKALWSFENNTMTRQKYKNKQK